MGRKCASPAPFLAYGGTYLKSRQGRTRGRPLTFAHTMHFVLRSSHARGDWSFRKPHHYQRVNQILHSFAERHGVVIRKFAIHLNHLHLHLKVPNARDYRRFIRAVTAAIAMAVTGMSRWNKVKVKFWDRRPFSRPVLSERARITVDDYIRINSLEAIGYSRAEARWTVEQDRRWERKRGP